MGVLTDNFEDGEKIKDEMTKDSVTAHYDSVPYAPFVEVGIPSACFIWGDEEGDLEEYYHTPQDTIEININLFKHLKYDILN